MFTAASLQAQTVTGSLQGRVIDKVGDVLPGVTITIRNLETGLERLSTTNAQGFFSAPFLPVGRYAVTAELSGFGTMSRQNVPVNLNQTTVQDFMLDPAVAETITVSSDAPRINVTDGEIKQTLRGEQIMDLPLPDQGSFLRLASFFAGYQENLNAGQDNPTLSSGSSVNFNGTGTRGATFQINGVNNDDSSENQHRQGVALATIKSFQILTNNFSSEFGRGYGSVVLVQTKSGTNQVNGEAYGYFQDAEYNELDIFNKGRAKPNRTRRQYGLTAGFPLVRDTLFAFVNGDMVDVQGTGFVTRGIFLPQDLALPRLIHNNDTPENRAFQTQILSYWRTNAEPNAPVFGTRAHTFLQDVDFPDRDYSGRLDYNLNSANNVNARYQRSWQRRQTSEFIVGEGAFQDNRQSNVGVTWTGILSADTVQEARYGLGLRSTNVNISAGNDTPVVRFNDTGITGTSFTILGNAGAFPINRNQRDQQFVYNISSARWASHTLKGGTDIRFSQLNDTADNNSRGVWTFNANCGGTNYGTGIAAFMAGCVASYVKGFANFYLENSTDEQNFYVQDDWRILDNLIVNLGVRYERVGATKEDQGRVDYGYSDTDYVDPRFGFAYTPDWARNRFSRALTGGQGKFSIRGGYGHFHGRIFQSIFSQSGASIRFNPPNAQIVSLPSTTPFPAPYSNYNISDPLNGYVFTPGTFPTGRFSITAVDPNLQMPESRQWNLTLERQIFWQSRLRASYIGTLGRNLMQYSLGNLPLPPDDPRSQYKVASDWRCAGTGSPGVPTNATCPTAVPIAADEISLRVPRTNERRPDARYTTNLVVSNAAKSWYQAGQLEWETALIGGFQGRASYTYGKAEDTGSEATSFGVGDVNILGPYEDYNRGLSRFDTRHRFTFAGSYRLPFFRQREDALGWLLGGWQLSSVFRYASGTPFTIVDGGAPDFNFDSVGNFRPVCVDPQYCSGRVVGDPATSRSHLPREAYRRVQYGDSLDDLVGRNTMFTGPRRTVDVGLYKAFRMPFGDSFVLRFDVFNVFDTVTWGLPVSDFNSPQFGTLTALSYSPRSFQAGLRYIY